MISHKKNKFVHTNETKTNFDDETHVVFVLCCDDSLKCKRERTKSASNSVCALVWSFVAPTTNQTKILSAKINKTKRKALDVDVDDVVTVAFNFNSTQWYY